MKYEDMSDTQKKGLYLYREDPTGRFIDSVKEAVILKIKTTPIENIYIESVDPWRVKYYRVTLVCTPEMRDKGFK